jgi:hypothetical protein
MPSANVVGDPWFAIFGGLKNLRAAWPSRGWSWDMRVSCVSSSFITELDAKARAAASAILPKEWTPATISAAPSALREIAERTGGLRTGQAIFSAPTIALGAAFAYGLWWPWGDGMTTSMRIGLGGPQSSHESMHQRLRDAFGVEL